MPFHNSPCPHGKTREDTANTAPVHHGQELRVCYRTSKCLVGKGLERPNIRVKEGRRFIQDEEWIGMVLVVGDFPESSAFPSPIQLKIPTGDCWHKVPGKHSLTTGPPGGPSHLPNLLSALASLEQIPPYFGQAFRAHDEQAVASSANQSPFFIKSLDMFGKLAKNANSRQKISKLNDSR